MAQYIGVLCDWCAHLGIEDVPAAVQRILAVDGPPRRVDLCHRCDLALAPFLALYAVGQDLPDDDSSRTARRRQRRSTEQEQRTPQRQKQKQEEQEEKSAVLHRGGRVRDDSKASLVCPLDHPHSGGGPSRVSYSGRSGHADMVHGLHFTQIAWQDPDRILAFPCTVHTACRTNGVSFTRKTGLTNHLNRYREPAAEPAAEAAADGTVVALLPGPTAAPPFLAASGE